MIQFVKCIICVVPRPAPSQSPMVSPGFHTEFLLFTTTRSAMTCLASSMFFPLAINLKTDYNIRMYFHRFNSALLPDANAALRIAFGGLQGRQTNTIFTNGFIDPWLYHGILFTNVDSSSVVSIERKYSIIFLFEEFSILNKISFLSVHAKSADLTSISEQDAPVVHAAKNRIREQITEWTNSRQ